MAEKDKEWTSAEDFVTKSPLYITVRVNGFNTPSEISFDCYGKCGKETTWGRVSLPSAIGGGRESQVADWKMKSVAYKCLRCKESVLTVIYREMKEEERVLSSPSNLSSPPSKTSVVVEVVKVGQYPAPSVSLPKGLEKGLGKEAAELYRRALVCRNSGYGLAAVGYVRRVVEDKTNDLIEVAAQLAEASGVDAATVTEIRAAADSKKYTAYEKKLEHAAAVFPESLKVGSINPLQVLFGLVSKGLHGLSEPQCIEVADGIRRTFEYLFTNLKAQVDEKRAFAEDVKRLSQSW